MPRDASVERELGHVVQAVIELADGEPGAGVAHCRRLLASYAAGQMGMPAGVPSVREEPAKRAVERVSLTKTLSELEYDAARGDKGAQAQLARMRRAEDADRESAA